MTPTQRCLHFSLRLGASVAALLLLVSMAGVPQMLNGEGPGVLPLAVPLLMVWPVLSFIWRPGQWASELEPEVKPSQVLTEQPPSKRVA
jgi:hypothetical protein